MIVPSGVPVLCDCRSWAANNPYAAAAGFLTDSSEGGPRIILCKEHTAEGSPAMRGLNVVPAGFTMDTPGLTERFGGGTAVDLVRPGGLGGWRAR